MVNYCCVYGCGRNSRTSKHLYFYSVPKDLDRQDQWLIAAGRGDLLQKPKRNLYRFCSRHFSAQNIKNKHLCADAVPTLYLPGWNEVEEASDGEDDRPMHSNIACNNCQDRIIGFRYKCVSCPDFDLCSRCEMAEAHEEHLMLRIPTPIKFNKVENMVMKWHQLYKEEHMNENESSDDEPIQKYAKTKNYDSGIDLSDDVKQTIRTEVARVLKLKKSTESRKKKGSLPTHSQKRSSDTDINFKKQKLNYEPIQFSSTPEVAFADVNDIPSVGTSHQMLDVKTETCTFPSNIEATEAEPDLPVMDIKLNDDLSDLMMEVGDPDQKSLYKF